MGGLRVLARVAVPGIVLLVRDGGEAGVTARLPALPQHRPDVVDQTVRQVACRDPVARAPALALARPR
ncbi:hypothetical protein N8J89_20250 [Crossiella sp. CA-258035]|uniref:hypothetical protein n=1 Tax=Crossiella sp. CA-258035 TaxID=2981138 RepID=UPI0024BC7374|nr:hypothetical protein [Crossiella sp. CA-258035]WHT23317.1 hypothetical protein N8J89_20250 [Crossiella sp. CA-258035]